MCHVLGMLGLLFFPLYDFSRQTYHSENALLIGAASSQLTLLDSQLCALIQHRITTPNTTPLNTPLNTPMNNTTPMSNTIHLEVVLDMLHRLGTRPRRHHFSIPTFNGTNLVALLPAKRGDGAESLLLSAPLRNRKGLPNSFGVSIILAMLNALRHRNDLARDILVVFYDSPPTHHHHVDIGLHMLMHAYYDLPTSSAFHRQPLHHLGTARQIIAGLNLEFGPEHTYSSLSILTEGLNGQMPNLDLVNMLIKLAQGRGLAVYLQDTILQSPPDLPGTLKSLCHYLLTGGTSIMMMSTAWTNYVSRLQNLLLMMRHQALGRGVGGHGVLIRYRVESLTLYGFNPSSSTSSPPHGHHPSSYHSTYSHEAILSITEDAVRSLNNILEKLHQSFFFWLLVDPRRYISIGMYLPPAVLLGVGMVLMAIWIWIGIQRGTGSLDESDSARDRKHAPSLVTKNQRRTDTKVGSTEDAIPSDASDLAPKQHRRNSKGAQKVLDLPHPSDPAYSVRPQPWLGPVVLVAVAAAFGGAGFCVPWMVRSEVMSSWARPWLERRLMGFETGGWATSSFLLLLLLQEVDVELGQLLALVLIYFTALVTLYVLYPKCTQSPLSPPPAVDGTDPVRPHDVLWMLVLMLASSVFLSVAVVNFSLSYGVLSLVVPFYLHLGPSSSSSSYAVPSTFNLSWGWYSWMRRVGSWMWKWTVFIPGVLCFSTPFGAAGVLAWCSKWGLDEWIHYLVVTVPELLPSITQKWVGRFSDTVAGAIGIMSMGVERGEEVWKWMMDVDGLLPRFEQAWTYVTLDVLLSSLFAIPASILALIPPILPSMLTQIITDPSSPLQQQQQQPRHVMMMMVRYVAKELDQLIWEYHVMGRWMWPFMVVWGSISLLALLLALKK